MATCSMQAAALALRLSTVLPQAPVWQRALAWVPALERAALRRALDRVSALVPEVVLQQARAWVLAPVERRVLVPASRPASLRASCL